MKRMYYVSVAYLNGEKCKNWWRFSTQKEAGKFAENATFSAKDSRNKGLSITSWWIESKMVDLYWEREVSERNRRTCNGVYGL